MSVSILSWLRATDAADLPTATYRLVVALVPLLDAGGEASLGGLEALTERTGIPSRTLKRHLAALQAAGLLERRRGQGIRATIPAKGPKVAPTEGAKSGPLDIEGARSGPIEGAKNGPMRDEGAKNGPNEGAKNGPFDAKGPKVAPCEGARNGPLDSEGAKSGPNEGAKNGPSPHTPLIGTLPSVAVAAAAATPTREQTQEGALDEDAPSSLDDEAPLSPDDEAPSVALGELLATCASVAPAWAEGHPHRLRRLRRDLEQHLSAHGAELVQGAVEDLLAWSEQERIESPPAALRTVVEQRAQRQRLPPIPAPVRRQPRPTPLPAPVAAPAPAAPIAGIASAGAFSATGAYTPTPATSSTRRPRHATASYDRTARREIYWHDDADNGAGGWVFDDVFVELDAARAARRATPNPTAR